MGYSPRGRKEADMTEVTEHTHTHARGNNGQQPGKPLSLLLGSWECSPPGSEPPAQLGVGLVVLDSPPDPLFPPQELLGAVHAISAGAQPAGGCGAGAG